MWIDLLGGKSRSRNAFDIPWVPSWELAYPPPKVWVMINFLFPRWDMQFPWRVPKEEENDLNVASPIQHNGCVSEFRSFGVQGW